MKRGPKPKPTALKLIEGNRGKRPINKNEPKPKLGQPKCPADLSEEARKEWHRIVPELHKIGMLALVDRAGLIVLCRAWGEYMEAELTINNPGFKKITASKHGSQSMSPWFRIRDSAFNRYAKQSANFGLSPADRTRLQVPTILPEEDGKKKRPLLAHQRKAK